MIILKKEVLHGTLHKNGLKILARITGETVDGEKVGKQDITSMLNKLEDLGPFTAEEWTLFFNKLRVEGI